MNDRIKSGTPLTRFRNVVSVSVRALIAMGMAVIPPQMAHADPIEPAKDPSQPNILIIVADDLGFSDIGAFGGEIETPNLDKIARQGLVLSNMHVAPTCSPTRAMLLTGKDPHTVGFGAMAEMPMPAPRPAGYEGYLTEKDTLPARLHDLGYTTMMSGKWHLGTAKDQWPSNVGFDRSFALLDGGANHFGTDQIGAWTETNFHPTYNADGKPAQYPIGAYSADVFTNRMLGFLQDSRSDGKPFFAYLTFTQPHWPLQAPASVTAKYRGRYDAGPSAVRDQRLARLKDRGLVPEDAVPAPLDGPSWSSRSDSEKLHVSHLMEIYAAMVDRLDYNVGRVLNQLNEDGRLKNTVIVFLSDNGASGSSWDEIKPFLLGSKATAAPVLAEQERINQITDLMGTSASFLTYDKQWALAAMAPFRLYKGFINEGGIRAPAMISGPGVVGGKVSHTLTSVRDLMPTLVEIAGGKPASPPSEGGGRSWRHLIDGTSDAVRKPDEVLVTEFGGRQMVLRADGWKAVYSDPDVANGLLADREAAWQLYNISEDPAEMRNLSADQPAILDKMKDAWKRYSSNNNILIN